MDNLKLCLEILCIISIYNINTISYHHNYNDPGVRSFIERNYWRTRKNKLDEGRGNDIHGPPNIITPRIIQPPPIIRPPRVIGETGHGDTEINIQRRQHDIKYNNSNVSLHNIGHKFPIFPDHDNGNDQIHAGHSMLNQGQYPTLSQQSFYHPHTGNFPGVHSPGINQLPPIINPRLSFRPPLISTLPLIFHPPPIIRPPLIIQLPPIIKPPIVLESPPIIRPPGIIQPPPVIREPKVIESQPIFKPPRVFESPPIYKPAKVIQLPPIYSPAEVIQVPSINRHAPGVQSRNELPSEVTCPKQSWNCQRMKKPSLVPKLITKKKLTRLIMKKKLTKLIMKKLIVVPINKGTEKTVS